MFRIPATWNNGLRNSHRKGYVQIGSGLKAANIPMDLGNAKANALRSLNAYPDQWRDALGGLVFLNTLTDLRNL